MDIMNLKLRAYWPGKQHLYQLSLLEAAGCTSIGDILNGNFPPAEILRIPGVGRGTLGTIKHAVLKAVVDWSCN